MIAKRVKRSGLLQMIATVKKVLKFMLETWTVSTDLIASCISTVRQETIILYKDDVTIGESSALVIYPFKKESVLSSIIRISTI